MEEDRFDLREFVLLLVRRWQVIALFALAGVVIGATAHLIPDAYRLLSGEAAIEDRRAGEEYRRQYRTLTRELEGAREVLATLEDYLDNSILMQVAAYDKPVAMASFYIRAINVPVAVQQEGLLSNDPTGKLAMAFAQALESGDLYRYILEQEPELKEPRYLEELITVTQQSYNGILTVEVTGTDLGTCQRVLEMMETYLQEKSGQYQTTIAEHQLSVIQQSTYTEVDLDLLAQQQSTPANLDTLEIQITQREKELEQLEEPRPTTVLGILAGSLFYQVLGAAAGGGLGVILVFFLDLMEAKIWSGSQLGRRLGIRFLGTVKGEGKQ